MLTLTAIALASGLGVVPAPAGSTIPAPAERARTTLDLMTSRTQARVREQTIRDALDSGVRTFRITMRHRLSDQEALEVAASVPNAASPAPTPVIK